MRRGGGLLVGAQRLAFIDAAVSRVLRAEDPLDFFTWLLREGQHRYAPLFPGVAGSRERNRLVYQTGRAVWDLTPLPSHGLRPRPLPPLGAEDACLCGAGVPYGRCCAGAPLPAPALPILLQEIRYVALRRVRPEALAALPEASLSPDARTLLAEIYLDAGQPDRAQALLLPLLPGAAGDGEGHAPSRDLPEIDEADLPALQMLLRCLARAWPGPPPGERPELRRRLLQRAVASPSGRVRALALHRLAQEQMDQGEAAAAWSSFERALREDPEHPDHGQVELALLVTEGRGDQARQRARYWLGRLRRDGDRAAQAPDSLVQGDRLRVFYDARRDPLLGLLRVDAQQRPEVGMLYRLLEELMQRPAQLRYAVVPHGPGEARLAHLPPLDPAGGKRGARGLQAIEEQWDREWVGRRPHGDALRADPGPQVLRRGLGGRWMSFLLGHSIAIDSLQVLDDLCQGVLQLEDAGRVWIDRKLLEPLLLRAETLAALALARLPSAGDRLTPDAPHNRLLLRLLTHLALLRMRVQERATALSLFDLLLFHDRLDRYGLRPHFADLALRLQRPELLLRHLDKDDARPPGVERDPALAFGRALALFQVGRRAEAARALQGAAARWPQVPRALLGLGQAGGDDPQAARYLARSCSLWQESAAALPWLAEVLGAASAGAGAAAR